MSLDGALEALLDRFGEKVVAIALFDSLARMDAGERSDIDLFIIVRSVPRGLERRRMLYDAAHGGLGGHRDVTIIDVEERELFSPSLEVTPLLLNIAWDSKVLYDPQGRLTNLFEEIRRMVERAGLERYKTPDGKYGWKPREAKPLEEVDSEGL